MVLTNHNFLITYCPLSHMHVCGMLEITNQVQLASSWWPGHTCVSAWARARANTHTHTHTHLEDACCQFLAWQTRNIQWFINKIPVRLGTLLRFRPIWVRGSQGSELLSIHTHTPPQHACHFPKCTENVSAPEKHLNWTISQAASGVSWFVLFFSHVIEMLFFSTHILPPLTPPKSTCWKRCLFCFFLGKI